MITHDKVSKGSRNLGVLESCGGHNRGHDSMVKGKRYGRNGTKTPA